MQVFSFKRLVHATAWLLLIGFGVSARAATLSVNCGGAYGLTSINAALQVLKNSEEPLGPNTINVSGACSENVLIRNMDQLAIKGLNGGSVSDASAGTLDVIDVRNSRVTITGLTIDGENGGSFDGVDCEQGSHCTLIGNTIQGGLHAVSVWALSSALIVGGTLQNNTANGILARGDVYAVGVKIQGNPVGALVLRGGRLQAGVADPSFFPVSTASPTTIANNGAGVQVTEGAEFTCSGCLIESNAGDGIHVDVSAAASIASGAVTGNAGFGVYVGDLSSASFHGSSAVSGNGRLDIQCASPTSVTRGALSAAGSPAHTNCTN